MPFLNEAWVAFLATSDVKKKLEEGLLQVVETPDPKGKARADAIELPVGEMPRNDIAPKRGLSETPMRKRSAARQSTRWMQT